MTETRYSVRMVPVDVIVVPEDHRPIDPSAIPGLAESISKVGLCHPITGRLLSDIPLQILLLGGAHRLAAHRALGLTDIPVSIVDDPVIAPLVARTDNLHRLELTAQQRAEELVKWLEETKSILGQSDQVSAVGGRGLRGGTAEAARRAGVDRTEARRAAAIAAITPEAKKAASDLGLANNQTALLEIARAQGSEDQVQTARDLAQKSSKKPPTTADQEFKALLKVWQRCRPAVRSRFIAEVVDSERGKVEAAAQNAAIAITSEHSPKTPISDRIESARSYRP